MSRISRRVAALAAVGAAVALTTGVSGCDAGRVDNATLQPAVAEAFARLYVQQQALHGRAVSTGELRTHSTCYRGADPAVGRSVGAGDDWTCSVIFDYTPGSPTEARYTLRLRSNGCYTADGEGPTEVTGQDPIVTPGGRSATNPLWRFDGCVQLLA